MLVSHSWAVGMFVEDLETCKHSDRQCVIGKLEES